MNPQPLSFEQSRRQFFSKIMPAGALCCLGCMTCFASSQSKTRHKFLENAEVTFKAMYDFAYKQGYIPIMKSFEKEMGKEAFIKMLKVAGAEMGAQQGKFVAQNMPGNELASFIAFVKRDERFATHVWTFETVEETDKTFEIKVTECLWADTFREANAADIGYATYCHADFSMARAFNPKMKMTRSKTLMEGHDCCNHRWELRD